MYISVKLASQTEELITSVRNALFSEYSFIAKGTVISRSIQIFKEKCLKFSKDPSDLKLSAAVNSTRLNFTSDASDFLDRCVKEYNVSRTAVIHVVLDSVLSLEDKKAKNQLRVLSLNVNDFGGLECLETYKKQNTYQAWKQWDQIDKNEQLEKIFDYISEKDPDVVVLEEYDEHSNEGKVFSQRMSKNYLCIPHSQHKRSSITIMFVKRGIQYTIMNNPHKKDLRANIIRIPLSSMKICIYGVHIPCNDISFWDELLLSYEQLLDEGEVLIIGDFNVYKEGTEKKKKYHELLKKGAVDLWIDKGYPNCTPTHKENRLDYAIASPNLKQAIKDVTISSELLYKEYTDHAALIVDICCP